MPELLTVPLRFLETESHAEKIHKQAAQHGLSVSSYLRLIVRQYTDPDGEMLRLVDSKEAYEEGK